MLGLGRPHTLQHKTTVSPNAHVTSASGIRNSGATSCIKLGFIISMLVLGSSSSQSDSSELFDSSTVTLVLRISLGLRSPFSTFASPPLPLISFSVRFLERRVFHERDFLLCQEMYQSNPGLFTVRGEEVQGGLSGG